MIRERTSPLTALLLSLGLAAAGSLCAQDSPPPVDSPSAVPAVVAGDAAAKTFLAKCAGCHSVGGVARSAPDLLPVSAWEDAPLMASIKRMEKNAGALSPEEVTSLAEFLKDSNVRSRLQAEEGRAVAAAAATLEPASVVIGSALFSGTRQFVNGGASCASCHAVGGLGGNLGPDLTTVHSRLGDTALKSAIEQANFRVMKPIYAARPITTQEAAHVSAYLETTGKSQPGSEPPIGIAALLGSAVFLGVLGLVGKTAKRGTRARLVSEAAKR